MNSQHERIAQLNREFQSEFLNDNYLRGKTLGEWLVSASLQDLKEIQHAAEMNQAKYQLGRWKPEKLELLPEPARAWEFLAVASEANGYEVHNLEDTLMIQGVPTDWVELVFQFKRQEILHATGGLVSLETLHWMQVTGDI